jgi:hypothetical protein
MVWRVDGCSSDKHQLKLRHKINQQQNVLQGKKFNATDSEI